MVQDATDRKALELSLMENLQREDLNPVEEAAAYQRLVQEFGLTQEQVAQAAGKDRATVANTLRLLKLAQPVREEIAQGRITLGHARALLGLESERAQLALAQRIVSEGLSVRRVEQLVKQAAGPARAASRTARDPHLAAAEGRLQRALGTQVQILHGRKRGWIRIAYYSLKDLNRLLDQLTSNPKPSNG